MDTREDINCEENDRPIKPRGVNLRRRTEGDKKDEPDTTTPMVGKHIILL